MKTLVQQMSKYAAYHRDPINKRIHFVFVPLIIWSAMGLISLIPPLYQTETLRVTWAMAVAAVLLLYYLRLDFPLGVALVVIFTVFLITSDKVAHAEGQIFGGIPSGWPIVLTVFVISWAAQFIGHKVFEHRKPALVDDLWQVFVAPLFVVAEYAFVLGLRKKLHDEVREGLKAHLRTDDPEYTGPASA